MTNQGPMTWAALSELSADEIKALPSDADHTASLLTDEAIKDMHEISDTRHEGRWNSHSDDSSSFDSFGELDTSFDTEHAALVWGWATYHGLDVPHSWEDEHILCTDDED